MVGLNVWSGGDYSKSTYGGTGSLTASISNEWCSNGDVSYKIIQDIEEYKYYQFANITGSLGETYQAKFNILNKSGEPVKLRLLQITDSLTKEVNIYSLDNVQTITATITLTTNSELRLRVVMYHPGTIFIDNITLIKI